MRVVISFLFIGMMYASHESLLSGPPWNMVYKKILSTRDRARLTGLSTTIIEKKTVVPFSQLIFSWNSIKPRKGYYTFWVQVRNHKSHAWGVWHKMIEWGNVKQCSYAQISGSFSTYHHVRLEVPIAVLADAFRIKMVAHDGADLSLISAYSVNISDFSRFVPESTTNIIPQLCSVHIPGVSYEAQFSVSHKDNKRICSPTCCAVLTRYLSGIDISPASMADHVYDSGLDAYGSWQFNTASLFHYNHSVACFFVVRLNSFMDIYEQLMREIPVIVSVRGAIDGAPKEYPHGHLLLVVGYDALKKAVICHDSATDNKNNVIKYYPLESFIRAWELSYRLTYWVELLS